MKTFQEYLMEGNPLARLKRHIEDDRHFVGMSAERSTLTPKENHARMKELKSKLKEQGYGYKRSKGVWEGGKENSLIVYAKGKGRDAGKELLRDMRKHAKTYDQDAILHHSGKAARLIGTNTSGYPGMDKKEPVGKVKYNRGDAPFQTQFKKGATFTTGE